MAKYRVEVTPLPPVNGAQQCQWVLRRGDERITRGTVPDDPAGTWARNEAVVFAAADAQSRGEPFAPTDVEVVHVPDAPIHGAE